MEEGGEGPAKCIGIYLSSNLRMDHNDHRPSRINPRR